VSYALTMSSAVKKRATYKDVLAAPERFVAEVIDGALHTHPRPAARHAYAASLLGAELLDAFHLGRSGPGGWIILDEPELHLGSDPDILVPDIAGWREGRLDDSAFDAAFFVLPPDWVCEVLSPSTQAIDRADKMDVYAREGVTHAWLLDPLSRTLEAFRLHGGRWVREGAWHDDAVVAVAPFEAIGVELARLWKP
jgi:Uma2 family endonuclease